MSAALPRARPVRRSKLNIVKFLLSVLLTTGVNLAAVPIVLHVAGTASWSGIAVAQSVANLAAVFVAFGWGVTGPTAIASRDAAARGTYFRDSIPARVYLYAIAAPITAVVTLLTAPGLAGANVLAALAVLTPALAAPWFFVGEQAPWRLLVIDTLPRSAGTAAGVAVILLSHSLIAFTLVQLAGAVVGVLLTLRSILARYPGSRGTWSPTKIVSSLAQQRHGITAAGAAAFYVNLPLIFVAVISPASTAVYAIADKLQKITILAFTPMLQVAQGHLGVTGAELMRRIRRLALLTAGVGLVLGSAFATLSPLAALILSGGRIVLPWSISIALGVAVAGICVSAVIGLACLAVLGRMQVVAFSTLVGAAVGVPLMVLTGHFGGATGVAWGVAASELLVVGIQLRSLKSAVTVAA